MCITYRHRRRYILCLHMQQLPSWAGPAHVLPRPEVSKLRRDLSEMAPPWAFSGPPTGPPKFLSFLLGHGGICGVLYAIA